MTEPLPEPPIHHVRSSAPWPLRLSIPSTAGNETGGLERLTGRTSKDEVKQNAVSFAEIRVTPSREPQRGKNKTQDIKTPEIGCLQHHTPAAEGQSPIIIKPPH